MVCWPSFAFDADGDFAERVNAFGDGVNVELEQCARHIDDGINGFVGRIHRTSAHRGMGDDLAIGAAQADSGGGHAHRAAGNLQSFKEIHIARLIELIGDQGFEIRIGDGLFAVGQFLETRKGLIEFDFIERVSHFGQACAQGMTPGMFAQHQRGLIDAHIFRAHDLIGGLMFQHPILMDARFVCEGICADNGLVRLDDNAGVIADEFADAADLFGVDSRFQTEDGMAGVQGHDHFFQRGIAGPFADAVDRYFGLTRACTNARQRVGGGHAQIIVAVNGNGNVLVHARRILDDAIDQLEIFIGVV